MPLIFKYFWFIGAAFMLVNVAIWRYRLGTSVRNGVLTNVEANQFIGWISAWLVGGPLLMGAIAMAKGLSSPFCAVTLGSNSVLRFLLSGFIIAAWATLLWWIWRGNGSEFLARVGPALASPPSYDKQYSPKTVRVVITAIVLFSAIGQVVSWRAVNQAPEAVCRAPFGASQAS